MKKSKEVAEICTSSEGLIFTHTHVIRI